MSSKNIVKHEYKVSLSDREKIANQKACIVWFTGLSGSGKSSIANLVEQALLENSYKTYLLDGDNVRFGLNGDLSFSDEDRIENIRRIRELSKLMMDAGLIVLCAFVSPFRADREKLRKELGEERFFEVFVDCPLELCESRDVKGLYKKARAGLIKDFTGISSPFEQPLKPEITLNTKDLTIEESVEKVLSLLLQKIKYTDDSV
jgi:adenylylsulfate kinase